MTNTSPGSQPAGPGSRSRWPALRRWFPRKDCFPRPTRWERVRGYLVAGLVAALVAGGAWQGPIMAARMRCGQWPFSGSIWRQGQECVGVTDGSQSFGTPPATQLVLRQIRFLNDEKPDCPAALGAQRTLTVGAMLTLTSPLAGIRAAHELEGIVAALRESRDASSTVYSCPYTIRLLVAQMGAQEQAASQDARILAQDGAVAVVGMGLSSQPTADAAQILTADHIPMVADVITAEGFDQTGSSGDHPDYGSKCARPGPGHADWEDGLGDYFFRVAYRASVQVGDIMTYLRRVPDPGKMFIVEPTDTSDPYTCTSLPLIQNGLKDNGLPAPESMTFTPADSASTQDAAAMAICAQHGPVTVFYTARAIDLGIFLHDIAHPRTGFACSPASVTVLSLSDAAQLRVAAPTTALDIIRRDDLRAPMFTSGQLKVLYTPLADPDLLQDRAPSNYKYLLDGFQDEGFGRPDLDDGWAIMGYDALAAVLAAMTPPAGSLPAQASQIGPVIQSYLDSITGFPGADGPITFRDGNRVGNGPGVVQLCPHGQPPGDPVPTAWAIPGKAPACPK